MKFRKKNKIKELDKRENIINQKEIDFEKKIKFQNKN